MSFIDKAKYFLRNRNVFTFSGNEIECEIVFKRDGVNSFKAFRLYDEKGFRSIETKHPETLKRLIKTKASLTFQIKQWAESRADGTLPRFLFNEMIEEMELPEWVINAVETQKFKYYGNARADSSSIRNGN